MKLKIILFLIILLVAVPAIHAVDTSDWDEITVNKVTFKIPEKFTDGHFSKNKNGYSQGEENFFHLTSLVKYNSLKSVYGSVSTDDEIEDIDEIEIDGRPCVVITNYNDYKDYDYLDIFFPVGKKIFRIQYPSSEVTEELKEIIKSAPESKMSEEKFTSKLDNAQRDYIEEDYQKNLELDMEDYYRSHNDKNSFVAIGNDGWTFGHMY